MLATVVARLGPEFFNTLLDEASASAELGALVAEAVAAAERKEVQEARTVADGGGS